MLCACVRTHAFQDVWGQNTCKPCGRGWGVGFGAGGEILLPLRIPDKRSCKRKAAAWRLIIITGMGPCGQGIWQLTPYVYITPSVMHLVHCFLCPSLPVCGPAKHTLKELTIDIWWFQVQPCKAPTANLLLGAFEEGIRRQELRRGGTCRPTRCCRSR